MLQKYLRRFACQLSVSLLTLVCSAVGAFVPSWAWSQEIAWYKAIDNDAQSVAVNRKGIYISGRKCYPGPECDGVVEARALNGAKRWRRQFSIFENTESFGVAVHTTGIYVAGRTEDRVGDRGPNGYVRKYDFSGNLVWTFLSAEPTQEWWDVTVDDTGIYFTGSKLGVESHVIVGMLDFSGNEVWVRALPDSEPGISPIALHGGTIFTAGRDMNFGTQVWALDLQGNLMSQFSLPDNLGTDLDRLAVDDSGLYFANYLGLIAKYDFSGVEIWRHQIPSDTLAHGGVIAVDSGRVYFGARSRDSNFELRRFDSQGNEQWRRQWVDGTPNGLATRQGKAYAAGFSGARYSSSGGLLVALDPTLHYDRLSKYANQKEGGVMVNDRRGCEPSQKSKYIFPVGVASQTNQLLRGLQFSVRQLVGSGNTLLVDNEWAHPNSRFFVPLVGDYADGELSPGELVEVPITVCQRGDYGFGLTLDLFGIAVATQ